MCGIAGIIYKRKDNWDFEKFQKSVMLMSHRGPDHFGIYKNQNIGLFHFRLSILDLDSRSNQPFFTDFSSGVIVYNGEVYNYKELAYLHRIQQKTTSDTEVLIKIIEQNGVNSIESWEGIFAFAYLDRNSNKVIFARDRFGIKPLYIFENSEIIVFSSEAKVILDYLKEFKINTKGLNEYMWYGNTLSTQTMVEGMVKLTPGTTLEIDLSNFRRVETCYWSINKNVKTSKEITFNNAVKVTRKLLEEAVKSQLISDVPIGVFLSGGIDSSAISAFASRHVIGKLNTYSVDYDFNIGGISELPKAKLIAKKFNTNHHEINIESKNIIQLFEKLVFQYDEPFADAASIPLFMLSEVCKSDVKVVLQGDGGDELFAGYRRYQILYNLKFYNFISNIGDKIPLNNNYLKRIERMANALNQENNSMRMAMLMTQSSPFNNPELIFSQEIRKQLKLSNPFFQYQISNEKFKSEDLVQRMLYTDMEIILPQTFLEKVDKATMLSSLESRVPFLDNKLASFALSVTQNLKLKNGKKKILLKKALDGIIPNEILLAPKRGFDVPYKEWLKSTFYDYAYTTFKEYDNKNNYFDKNKIMELLIDHKNNVADNGVTLWRTLILIVWLNNYKNKFLF